MSETEATETTETSGVGPWYVAATVATLVSVDTSWRFFGERLHITWIPERIALFAVLEIMLFAAGYSMRAGVRRSGSPGTARFIAWALAAVSGYMAIELSGPLEGLARVTLGPVLAIVALHQALGIELKVRHGQRTGTFARIGRELRERALSRMGLADDQRDALTRTKQRAAIQAATIATSGKVSRQALRKAVLKSGAATDPKMRELIVSTTAALKTVDALTDLDAPSPWTPVVDATVVDVVDVDVVPVPRPPRTRPALSNRPTSGGTPIEWDVDKAVEMILKDARPADVVREVGISAKNVQRVTRVVRGLAAHKTDEDMLSPGNITASFVARVRASYEKTMEATA